MRIGVDGLMANHYEKEYLACIQPGDAGGIFLRTAGDARPTVLKIVRQDRIRDLVVHMAPFDYSHQYPLGKYLPGVKKDAPWLNDVAVQNPSVRIFLSPFCENNHPASTMRDVFASLAELAPRCTMLNSVGDHGEEVVNTVTEFHIPNGSFRRIPKNKDFTISFDGCGSKGEGDMPDTDLSTIMRNYGAALHIRGWNWRNNGKYTWDDHTPIAQRTYWPNLRYLKAQRESLRIRTGSVTWKNGLYKQGEDSDTPHWKIQKAMAILPVDRDEIKVRDSKGRVIDIMERVKPDYHTPELQGARYYSHKYQFELAQMALANTGSPLIKIHTQPLTDGYLRSRKFK